MATLLIKNGWLVNPLPGMPQGRLDLSVVDGAVARIEPAIEPAADRVIDASGRVIMPGLVQSHIHLCQTLFRGLANDLSLLNWLRTRIWPLEAAHDEESLYLSAKLGLAELIRGGTTAIIDMGTLRHTDAIFHAIAESGLRAQAGKAMMDHPRNLPEYLAETTDAALDDSVRLLERWHGQADGRIRYGFAPRAAIACSEACLRSTRELSDRYGVPVHTHGAETPDEVSLVQAEHGRRNITYLSDIGICGPRAQIAHCIWLDDDEMHDMRRNGTHVLHCPSSNLKLGSGLARIPEMVAQGINVSIGADGAPCNNNLDGFLEMRLASLMQKPRLGPQAMPAVDSFRLATLGGATAMGLESAIGSLEIGKRADIVLLDTTAPHCSPFNFEEPAAQIVYSSRASDVCTTIVDGRVLMLDRQLLTIDVTSLPQDARRSQERVIERARRLGYV
jgi:5-methylthioadenosine/S-adenosylhomocysteine deaminase